MLRGMVVVLLAGFLVLFAGHAAPANAEQTSVGGGEFYVWSEPFYQGTVTVFSGSDLPAGCTLIPAGRVGSAVNRTSYMVEFYRDSRCVDLEAVLVPCAGTHPSLRSAVSWRVVPVLEDVVVSRVDAPLFVPLSQQIRVWAR